jgi:hypothetical protein
MRCLPHVNDREDALPFICLGCLDERKWDTMSKSDQDTMMKECFAYDDILRKNGHFVLEATDMDEPSSSYRSTPT